MAQHAMYWKGLLQEGRADLFGLVADPSGGWGVAVANVEDLDAITKITEADPVILSQGGFSYDIFPMPRGAVVR